MNQDVILTIDHRDGVSSLVLFSCQYHGRAWVVNIVFPYAIYKK